MLGEHFEKESVVFELARFAVLCGTASAAEAMFIEDVATRIHAIYRRPKCEMKEPQEHDNGD